MAAQKPRIAQGGRGRIAAPARGGIAAPGRDLSQPRSGTTSPPGARSEADRGTHISLARDDRPDDRRAVEPAPTTSGPVASRAAAHDLTGVGRKWDDGHVQASTSGPTLIGRTSELETLRESLAEAHAGSARTVVLSGEAGIGKTRLVEEFVGELDADIVVARGQSIDLDDDAPPYAPAVSVLRALSSAFGPEAVGEASGAGLASLTVLLPELSDETRADDTASPNGGDRLYEAVATLLDRLSASRPLVIVVEDLHWADQATLALLRFLVRVLDEARVLFVFTLRADEVRRGTPLHAWLPELERMRQVSRRELARMRAGQVRQLMASIMGRPPSTSDVSDVFARTEGVPFFVEEFVCCDGPLITNGYPETLRELLLARYENVSEATQRMLRLMAAGDVRVEHELLEAVYPGDPLDIETAAREAVLAGILVVHDTAFTFRHALVRDAIHDQLLPSERVRFHAQYARALEDTRGAELADAIQISYHWMAAHDVPRAFSASLIAMHRAQSAYAYASAARMAERAIELWQHVPDAETIAGITHPELLALTANLQRNAGESERAIDLIDEALASPEPIDRGLRARMLRGKASYLANLGQLGSIGLLREALEVLDDPAPSLMRANVLGELAARLMLDTRLDEAISTADAAYLEAHAVESRDRMSVAANIRGLSRMWIGEIDEGLADLELAGELAEGNESARLRYRLNRSDALNHLGRYSDAIRVAEEGAERAQQRGLQRTTGVILMSNVIAPMYALGQTARANELLDRALEVDAPIGFSAHLQLLKLRCVLWGGDPDGAARLLRGWRGGLVRQSRIDGQARTNLARIAAEIALEFGHNNDAWAEVSWVLGEEHRLVPGSDLPLFIVVARALAAFRGSTATPGQPSDAELDRAEARLRELVGRSVSWPSAASPVALVEAELGGANHNGSDPELWRSAIQVASSPLSPAITTPYAHLRLAESLATVGDRAAAQQSAAQARAAAEQIDAGLIVGRADALVRRIGGRGTSDESASAGRIDANLTERELQVLTLVAQGLSNRQVAEELYISPKTASVHVSNILRKVGASSRTEAAFVLRELTAARPRTTGLVG